jgi:hypothetical protein
MRNRPRRVLVLPIPAEYWDRLVAAAARHERDPYQHARWLILRGLADQASESSRQEEPATADVA